MERTNLNFNTVKTNLDDKKNILVKNNFVDTNNYVKQNLFSKHENSEKNSDHENQEGSDYYTNQRNRSIINQNFNLNEYTRRKVVPITDSTTKYKVTRINVDSHYRTTNPKNILDSVQHLLPENPLYFQTNSNLLTIYDPNHNYIYDDKIIIKNLTTLSNSVKIAFEKNNYYVRVEYENHNLNPSYNYLVLFSNFIGNSQNNTLFDNIPINYINKIHNVYFSSDTDTATNDYFYIKINITPNIGNNALVDAMLFSLNGVPLNNINSDYPITINQSQSSLTIVNVISPNYYQVALSSNATVGLIDNTNLSVLTGLTGSGGNNILISKINDVIEGFPNANHFKYNLGRNFNKVKKIRLISSEIPNTEKTIKQSPAAKQNNLLYWQNVDDGEVIYKINITPGNYSLPDLGSEIQTQIIATPRQNQVNVNTNKIIYLNDHFATVSLIQTSNQFEINYYSTVILSQAIKKSTYTFADGFTRIIVNHPTHKLNKSDTILIENAIGTEGIPNVTLNGVFTLEVIIDPDNYQIKLDKFNAESVTTVTGGGNAIKVLTPLQSRLLFDKPGTIGNLLGFRNVGDYNAVTIYSKKLTNYIAYELDSTLNSIGIANNDLISNLLLNFNGYNYVYLTLNYIFKDSINTRGIQNIFAKLLLSGDPNTIIYNDFIQIGQEFIDPIASLGEIEFFFYTPDGELFDFNNIDVSFTIELFEEI
jgi:hypothetical protein